MTADGAALHVPAYPVKLKDTSGAGDTVVAALAVMLAMKVDYEPAVRAANAAAAVVVGKRGTATVSAAELRSRILPAASLASEEKVVFDWSVLDERLAEWRGLRIGFTNGCFDLLHPGHIKLLSEARAACDRLIVGLNDDASLRRLKGEGRPLQDVHSRAEVLAALEAVDLVVVFDQDTPLELIRRVRPKSWSKARLPARGGTGTRIRRERRRRSDPHRSRARLQHDQDRLPVARGHAELGALKAAQRKPCAPPCPTRAKLDREFSVARVGLRATTDAQGKA